MNLLGNAGSLYMAILITLLIIGLGSIGLWLIKQAVESISSNKQNKAKGGDNIQDSPWLKLALFSFLGLIITVALLSLVSPSGVSESSHNAMHSGGMMANTAASIPMGGMQMMGSTNGQAGFYGYPMPMNGMMYNPYSMPMMYNY
ncbi:MAG: hypothetical protein ACM3UZ_07065 [Acidobacteriota bacterium]